MTAEEIYVALLDEGVDVWRPAPAYRVDDATFVLLRPDDYDPEDETWEFPPGAMVECEHKNIRDGQILAAVRRVNLSQSKSA